MRQMILKRPTRFTMHHPFLLTFVASTVFFLLIASSVQLGWTDSIDVYILHAVTTSHTPTLTAVMIGLHWIGWGLPLITVFIGCLLRSDFDHLYPFGYVTFKRVAP